LVLVADGLNRQTPFKNGGNMQPAKNTPSRPYEPPRLESHPWRAVTGISLPIGNGLPGSDDFLDFSENLGGEQ
jgi:hypothetical protein